MKISLKDVHLFSQVISFANENVTNEYIKKIEKVNEFMKQKKDKDT